MGMFKIELDLDFDSIIGERHMGDGGYDEPETVEPYRFGEMVVAEIARQLLAGMESDVRRELRDVVAQRARALIDERLTPIINAAFEEGVALTNTMGERTGKTVTMRELIVDRVSHHMRWTPNARFDSDKSTLAKAIDETTQKVLAKDLAAEVAAAKADIRQRVHESAAEVMTAAIVQGLTR